MFKRFQIDSGKGIIWVGLLIAVLTVARTVARFDQGKALDLNLIILWFVVALITIASAPILWRFWRSRRVEVLTENETVDFPKDWKQHDQAPIVEPEPSSTHPK